MNYTFLSIMNQLPKLFSSAQIAINGKIQMFRSSKNYELY